MEKLRWVAYEEYSYDEHSSEDDEVKAKSDSSDENDDKTDDEVSAHSSRSGGSESAESEGWKSTSRTRIFCQNIFSPFSVRIRHVDEDKEDEDEEEFSSADESSVDGDIDFWYVVSAEEKKIS